MTDEKWEQLTGQIKDSFKVLENETREEELEGETTEVLVFENEAGKMKLVRNVRPRVIEQKSMYSNRKGATADVQNIYSDTETVDKVVLFKDEDGEWLEIDVSALG
jgi:hypothetical protein